MEKQKILFIDSVLHRNDATGITLSNLFADWPKEKLFMIGDLNKIQLSKDIGFNNHFVLTDSEYKHRFPINVIKFLKKIKLKKKNSNNSNFTEKIIELPKTKLHFFEKIFIFFGLGYYFFNCKLSTQLKNWINESNPDYIYAVLSTRHSINFALNLTEYINKPLIIHILDDWPSTIGNDSYFSKYWNSKINIELNNLIDLSYRRIAISEKMADEYTLRYKSDWCFFHNPIDLSIWKPFQKSCIIKKETNIIKIAYLGRIGKANDEAIRDFIKGVVCFNLYNLHNCVVEFHIYTNMYSQIKDTLVKTDSNIILHSFISNNEVPREISKFDFLLLPISFNNKDINFARLSMPTKFSEYLVSGVPVILMAPNNIAVTEYSKKYNCAFLLDKSSAKEISDCLMIIFKDIKLQQLISDNAKFIAEIKFSSLFINESFHGLFD